MDTIVTTNRPSRQTAALVGILICSLVIAAASSAIAQTPSAVKPFNKQHQAGIRLGGWSNSGDLPPVSNSSGNVSYTTDFKGGAFYFEGFVGLRFSAHVIGELSFGIFNRGDVNLRDDATDYQFFGNLLIYPLLARAKFYPLATTASKLQPYFSAGGGFYYGHHDIQYYQSDVYFSGFNTQSATSFEYTLGGGFDLPVAEKIALELSTAWMPLKFGKDLITIRKYDGMAITIGVKYLFTSIK